MSENKISDATTRTNAPAATRLRAPADVVLDSDRSQPHTGSVLMDRYQLDAKLGEGGMGVVYKAIDLRVNQFKRDSAVVAVKILRSELRSRTDALVAMVDEVDHTRNLQHENIINVHSFEYDENNAFMVMEYLEGRPLDRIIASEYALGMPFDLAWPIISGVGHGLSHAHKRGIIHSDFKPSNAFVTAAGAKVLDFGIARAGAAHLDRDESGLLGLTPAYASCEMLEEQRPDMRDDVYAFGLVVYELLSGRHPFDRASCTMARDAARTISPIRGTSRRQHAALQGALSFRRNDRTATIQGVLDELAAGAKGPGRKWLWVTVGALTLIAGGIGSQTAYRYFGPQDSDKVFVEHLLASRPSSSGAVDAQTVADLMDQGNSYLEEGLKPFDAGLLSENVSSALGAFQEALRADPNNRRAAEGILAIVNAYKVETNRLVEAGQYKEADESVEIALRIWPDSVDLGSLRERIRKHLKSDPKVPS